jgi:2-C-methyl-D-erythritol 4-phosphate cytidylyltransferase
MRTNAIILAAGKSLRAKTNKQFFKIKNKYLIEITLEKFLRISSIKKIILALSKENLKKYGDIFKDKRITVVEGGATRIASLMKSSFFIEKDADVVMVHDGARPFVSEKLIKKIEKETLKYGAVVPVIDLKDTVKEIKNNLVLKTLNRDNLKFVQTPQSYTLKIFEKLISRIKNLDSNPSDDAQLIEKIIPVHIVEGEETNIKITTPLDLKIAEVIYEETEKKNN